MVTASSDSMLVVCSLLPPYHYAVILLTLYWCDYATAHRQFQESPKIQLNPEHVPIYKPHQGK